MKEGKGKKICAKEKNENEMEMKIKIKRRTKKKIKINEIFQKNVINKLSGENLTLVLEKNKE